MNRIWSLFAFRFLATLILPATVFPTTVFLANVASAAATVNYQGFLVDGFGIPIDGGFVIAGTFAPGFDPTTIACVYGDDSCNVGPEYYDLAVADGTLRPIGAGVLTAPNGAFSGTGVTNEPAGSQIYLFGFPAFPSYEGVLATGNDPSYLVPLPGGTTTVNAAFASDFIFGRKEGDALALDSLPFPEPSAATLATVALGMFFATRRHKKM